MACDRARPKAPPAKIPNALADEVKRWVIAWGNGEDKALERAMQKAERLHGLYLRTLKALQDQRRPRPPVVVWHAEQVNVGPVRISVANLGLPFHSSEATP
jgi:hypothetical protein